MFWSVTISASPSRTISCALSSAAIGDPYAFTSTWPSSDRFASWFYVLDHGGQRMRGRFPYFRWKSVWGWSRILKRKQEIKKTETGKRFGFNLTGVVTGKSVFFFSQAISNYENCILSSASERRARMLCAIPSNSWSQRKSGVYALSEKY